MRATVQIESGRSAPDDGKQITFTDESHARGNVTGSEAQGESIRRGECFDSGIFHAVDAPPVR